MSNALNRQVFITSISKAVANAKKTGKMDLHIQSLFYLYNYYLEFTEDIAAYDDVNYELKTRLAKLKYKYPEHICNYKTVIGSSRQIGNLPPVVADNTADIFAEASYQLKVSDFTVGYTDETNAQPYQLVITPSVTLYSDAEFSIPVVGNQEFNLSTYTDTVLPLYYKRNNTSTFTEQIASFRISDFTATPLYSNIAKLNITASQEVINLPISELGDNTVYVEQFETILTLAMFTGGLAPPYNDPENDLLDAIRIDEISEANKGTFYINGVAIQEGDIITREEMAANLFVHKAAQIGDITSDVFEFSARDEGSKIWIN